MRSPTETTRGKGTIQIQHVLTFLVVLIVVWYSDVTETLPRICSSHTPEYRVLLICTEIRFSGWTLTRRCHSFKNDSGNRYDRNHVWRHLFCSSIVLSFCHNYHPAHSFRERNSPRQFLKIPFLNENKFCDFSSGLSCRVT